MKRRLLNNLKNIIGWKTNRRIVVFSVDDYGNVRLNSKRARNRMDEAGLKVYNRFDAFDALETKEDLEALYEVLTAVEDKNSNHAIFTPFALPCNINFDKMQETGYEKYYYELLPETFEKLSMEQPAAYSGAWQLLKEGIDKELMVPLFHGREHLNLKILKEKLAANDHEVLTALENRSYTSISSNGYQTISPLAAFDFWDFEENDRLKNIIVDGLNKFEEVFGYRSKNFTPPDYNAHPTLYNTLKKSGVRYIDTALIANHHQGNGAYKRQFNYTGKKENGLCKMVRNVVFEPTHDRGVDWPSYTINQIEAAFRWKRPAIISSHRVNFCGHIDEKNRGKGLRALKELLKRIVSRWPEVEFMAANELGDLISAD